MLRIYLKQANMIMFKVIYVIKRKSGLQKDLLPQ